MTSQTYIHTQTHRTKFPARYLNVIYTSYIYNYMKHIIVKQINIYHFSWNLKYYIIMFIYEHWKYNISELFSYNNIF